MRRLSIAAAAALLVISLAPTPAAACSCMRVPPETSFNEHDAVFEGRVISMSSDGDRVVVQLAVVQQWKGVTTETVELSTANNSAACGIAFEVDTSWLVYADQGSGGLTTGLCSRTMRMSDAEEDRAFLGAGEVPVEIGEDDEVEEPGQRDEPPARGGCASCTVGAGGSSPKLGFALSALMFGLLLRRRTARR